ncbi:MAG: hypothetical protein ACRELB_17280, partial [Polyangiaceae bacterium]
MSELTRIKTELGALPERSPETVSHRHALVMLLPELRALKEKGYDLAAIVVVLKERGLLTSEGALKKALRDGGKSNGKAVGVRRAGARRGPARAPGEPEDAPQEGELTFLEACARDEAMAPKAGEARAAAATQPRPDAAPVPESPVPGTGTAPERARTPAAPAEHVVGMRPINVGPTPTTTG